ncbi:MAG TPA: glutamate racemase [Chlamydiales bacterium]|nr:glutamate racemase [Chlamydiales bacterium]
MSHKQPIAIFDSGIGGLTVVKALKEALPCENILYLADNLRMPYGSRDRASIAQFTNEALGFFQKQHVKLIIFACHTVSSVFSEHFSIPIINVIQGGIQAIGEIPACKKVAILGTERTIQSGVYEKNIRLLYPQIEVYSVPCPKLAPMIESQDREIEKVVQEYLKPIPSVDAILLACTHYPLIKPIFQQAIDIPILDSAENTVREVKAFLSKENLLNASGSPQYQFFATETNFSEKASRILGHPVRSTLVNLIEENSLSEYKE